MAADGEPNSWKQMLASRPAETHIACFCRPKITHCGRYTPGSSQIEVTQMDAEKLWCAGCLVVFRQQGCGVCGCKYLQLCNTCEAASQR